MRRLRLTPARDLVDTDVPPIIPDVAVEYDEDGDQYIAALADGVLPPLRVSRQYEQMAKDREQPKETREFKAISSNNAMTAISRMEMAAVTHV